MRVIIWGRSAGISVIYCEQWIEDTHFVEEVTSGKGSLEDYHELGLVCKYERIYI